MKNKNIAIVGAGASGCICAYFLSKQGFEVSMFDYGQPLRTILPTGGGRCNLAHAEYDFKELAKNYPRGEKFLYSVFSKFSTAETLSLFEEMGIETYTQENGRIFPISNSSKNVREVILKNITGVNFINEKVIEIKLLECGFKVVTQSFSKKNIQNSNNKKISQYFFTDVILATGGHSGYDLAKNIGHTIVQPNPSLVGLRTKESLTELSGMVIKNACCNNIKDDILFTHFGVSGPLIYTISSIKAFEKMPYKLSFDLCPELLDLQKDLDKFPHRDIKNILNKYLPNKFVSFILKDFDDATKAHNVNGKMRDYILNKIHNFEITITGTNSGEETVTAGGVELKEVNSKTMESKLVKNFYIIGEVLNIDGFCGGFNLQNAWSTAFVAYKGIESSLENS